MKNVFEAHDNKKDSVYRGQRRGHPPLGNSYFASAGKIPFVELILRRYYSKKK